jgi:hypothetical protein
LPRISFRGTFLPLWALVFGLGALAVAGIWFAASAGPGPGPVFLVFGLVILGMDLWVYWLRRVSHVTIDPSGQLHFSGPRVSIRVLPVEVRSMTYWWMDWFSVSPRYLRTAKGNFFLLPGLQGPSDLFEAIAATCPGVEVRRVPL